MSESRAEIKVAKPASGGEIWYSRIVLVGYVRVSTDE